MYFLPVIKIGISSSAILSTSSKRSPLVPLTTGGDQGANSWNIDSPSSRLPDRPTADSLYII
jgi:hypothetical protein